LKAQLTKGLSKEEKEELVSSFNGAGYFRTQLTQVLLSEEKALERKGLREEDYDNPTWRDKQVFNNGRLSMLRQIMSYLEKE
jgi:hypothetical protein